MQFTDRVTVDGTRITNDGYLAASARIARTGVQYYMGMEIDPKNEHGLRDRMSVGVYRSEAEVFAKDSLSTLAHKPLTNNHPPVAVTSENWKDYAIGSIGDEIARDGDFIRVPLVVMDAAAIRAIESGKRELSAGYQCEITFEDGVAPSGESYQATQRSVRFNHVSVVDAARAGHEARIGDNWGVSPIPQPKQESVMDKLITVDGLQVVTNDAGAQAIAKLMADAATARTAHDAALAAKDILLAAADAKLAKAEAERDAALAKVLDDAAIDARVAARGDLVARVKVLAPAVVADGKSDLDVKRAVLAERKISLDGKSDAYIEARFDTLVEDHAGADNTASQLADKTNPLNDADAEAKALADANNHNAWRAA